MNYTYFINKNNTYWKKNWKDQRNFMKFLYSSFISYSIIEYESINLFIENFNDNNYELKNFFRILALSIKLEKTKYLQISNSFSLKLGLVFLEKYSKKNIKIPISFRINYIINIATYPNNPIYQNIFIKRRKTTYSILKEWTNI